ncbi:basic salivary proline-rich protein 4-like [Patiria miniata]|uniref:Uncharacterized protein n=1 Tax=Patiria miniata TaxID=46514 RepID=A0A914B402_PATMI|nr:basic salivary proline-rich protein 4-like [Patiria miniata]
MSNPPPQGHQHHPQSPPVPSSSSSAPPSAREGLVGSPTVPQPPSSQPVGIREGDLPAGRVGHNGEAMSSPGIVDGAYDSDRGNSVASTGSDDRKLTPQNRPVAVFKSRTSSSPAAPVAYAVRPIPQHHLTQQQRIPYIAKRAMSPQTHHPIVWQSQAAAAAAAAAASQGWTQYFPRQTVVPQGLPQSVSPHGGARYQPQPQPYPAYTSHTPPISGVSTTVSSRNHTKLKNKIKFIGCCSKNSC